MPSTLVHVAVGGLVGAALLGDDLDRRAVAVVLVAAALPDLDTFAGLVLGGAHRSLLHNLVLPAVAAGALAHDAGRRGEGLGAAFSRSRGSRPLRRFRAWLRPGRIRARWGTRGERLAGVALASFVCGGVLPDLFTNGVNVFYPLYDAFYTVDGHLLLSNQRGVVQTFVDLTPPAPAPTTETLHYSTGVDPSPGAEPEGVERVFPVVRGGWQLMLVLLSAGTLAARLREER